MREKYYGANGIVNPCLLAIYYLEKGESLEKRSPFDECLDFLEQATMCLRSTGTTETYDDQKPYNQAYVRMHISSQVGKGPSQSRPILSPLRNE